MRGGPIVLRSDRLSNQIEGDAVVASGERVTIDGEVIGNLAVQADATLLLAGLLLGTLTVFRGAHAEVSGMVKMDVRNAGTLLVSGTIQGAIREQPGASSRVMPGAQVIGGTVPE